jgi:hypothetical protein
MSEAPKLGTLDYQNPSDVPPPRRFDEPGIACAVGYCVVTLTSLLLSEQSRELFSLGGTLVLGAALMVIVIPLVACCWRRSPLSRSAAFFVAGIMCLTVIVGFVLTVMFVPRA